MCGKGCSLCSKRRKVWPKGVRDRAKGHITRHLWNRDFIPVFLILELEVFTATHFWKTHFTFPG